MKGRYAGVKIPVIQSTPKDQVYMGSWACRHLIETTARCGTAKAELVNPRHRRPGSPHAAENIAKAVQHEQVEGRRSLLTLRPLW